MIDKVIHLAAPAKLTVSLRIVGRRDDGYHLIDAEMVTLSLEDRLDLSPGDGVRIDGEASGAMRGETDGTDLVSAALGAVGHRARVVVHKEIPPGAGLGGGSADAAAILRWAGCTDAEKAVSLGADVPFCVVGGRARVTGIGEQVTPLPPSPRTLTLLTPPIACSTPLVYRRWDEMRGPVDPRHDGNDLTAAALDAYPELARYRDLLGDAAGSSPRLAGSGSTWWVEGAHAGSGRRVVHTTGAPEWGVGGS